VLIQARLFVTAIQVIFE